MNHQLELVHADPHNPVPFPDNLKLKPKLAVTITKLIPKEQRHGLSNKIICINKLHQLMNETLKYDNGIIHATTCSQYTKGAISRNINGLIKLNGRL